MISGKNNNIFGALFFNVMYVLIYRVGTAGIPFTLPLFCKWRQYRYTAVHPVQIPRFSDPYMMVQLKRTVLCKNTDGIDSGVYAITQRKINNPVFPAIQNSGFSKKLRQNSKPASFSSG
jgi:hypothetical protein